MRFARGRRPTIREYHPFYIKASSYVRRISEAGVRRKGHARRVDNPIIQLVGFRLDNEDYAIAITKIQEIILMKPITRIPQVPDFIEGLINLRGSVIPIVNLRKRFGLPARCRLTMKPAQSWSTFTTRRSVASSTR